MPPRHQRRDGRAASVLGLVLVAVLLLGLGFSREFSSGAATIPNTLPTSVPSTVISNTTTTTGTTTTTTTTVPKPRNQNPFLSPVLADYLRHRDDDVTAGLFDVRTGRTYLYRPGRREVTASMFKIDILADLLYQHQLSKQPLNARDMRLATSMIELSNNNAAQALWVQVGQVPAIDAFNKLIGFTQSVASYTWGQMDTTPRDQLEMLKAIVLPNDVLDPASRTFEMNLMEHVTQGERFGIPTDVPADAVVGVKNGWYPEDETGWQVNSAGFVQRDPTSYLAVVMTAHDADESYGIGVVNTVGRLFWSFESTHQ